jgi:hypothetical protein
MAGADGVIDVGRNAPKVLKHCIKVLTAIDSEERL